MSVISRSVGHAGETPLQQQLQLFRELLSRLIDAILNRIFDLQPEKATRRARYLFVLFLLSIFFVSLRFYPMDLWVKYVRDMFQYSVDPAYRTIYVGNPFVNFTNFSIHVFTDPRIFQYVPVFLAPFFIALQAASLYLADIFELDRVSVARRFIWGVAIWGSEETIRIKEGNITEESRLSPAFLIGGPGKVIVDLDSVALFERPDGTPRVIGPTAKEPHGRASLGGFERFRQAIDIRDHYVELRDQDPRSQSVKSRSLDGIPITATDVRLMFSVYRGGQKPSNEMPYPFSKEAIEQIIYNATSKVTPGGPNPSTYEFSWINRMVGLIRGELGAFMSKHRLTAYLANIGIPEIEKRRQREEALGEQKEEIMEPAPEGANGNSTEAVPDFLPRSKITNLFTQFADQFTKRARSNGVELHWIGVGTWKTPVGIVPEKHLEAWKLSNENLARESPEALKRLEQDAILNKTIALIQDVPIAAYQETVSDEKDANKVMRTLLLAYHQQLLEAAEFMRDRGEAVPPHIEEAISHIHNMFGHFL
jgi:hypothetical protein